MEAVMFEKQCRARNILIAVDASEHSLEAVRYVGQLIPVEGAGITLFHVLNPVPDCFWDTTSIPCFERQPIGTAGWQAQQERIIHDFMDRAIRLLLGLGYPREAISVLIRERELGIARDIAREAQTGYDALVVGRRGMSAVRDLIIGSIAHKLVNYLNQATVWVVGGHPDPAKILIAMDGSEGARRAVEFVGKIFDRSHPDILLLHVTRGIEPLRPCGEEFSPEADWLEKARQELERAERAMATVFEDCIQHLEQQGADAGRIKTKIVQGVYSRAAAIFGEAREEGCGTIVLGRRGISRVEEFFMGRVSSKVLQLAQEMAVWIIH